MKVDEFEIIRECAYGKRGKTLLVKGQLLAALWLRPKCISCC